MGRPGEVVRLEDCEAFLREAARRDLVVTSLLGVEVLEGERVYGRFGWSAHQQPMHAGELLEWGLFARRPRLQAADAPQLGVEFDLAPADWGEADDTEDMPPAPAPGSRRRRLAWSDAAPLLLAVAAVIFTAALVWSFSTASACLAAGRI